jgi:hypothetical protein
VSRGCSSGQLVGIDLHRRRSVICWMSTEGEVLATALMSSRRGGHLNRTVTGSKEAAAGKKS